MSKVWLITGSSRGLGRALAEAVLASGDQVVATARDVAALDGLGGEHFPLDVTDAEAARGAVAFAVERFGRLDVVVNNAGYADAGSFEEMAPDVFDAQMRTNFYGVVNVTRAALPVMRRQRSGRIIQVSTAGGRTAHPGLSAYHASKFAIEGLSETVAKEVAPFGVKVTIAEPGGMRTDWAGSSMRIYDFDPDYAPSIGEMVKHYGDGGASFAGDPAKFARALIELASMEDPPLRIPFGSDTVKILRAAAEADIASIDRRRELSESTDADDAVPFDMTTLPGMQRRA
jgi:NAD(P)-dependent dehydrogenase (short-subunit alcohol dehydrogenase family)